MKKHHCKSCQRRFCGKCSSVEIVSDLLVDKAIYNVNLKNISDGGNSSNNLNNNNKFRLCHDCHDIFTVADDIFAMVQHRKQKMFNSILNQSKSTQPNVTLNKGLINTSKNDFNNGSYDDGDKENTTNNTTTTTKYYISPNKRNTSSNITAVKSIRSPLKESTTTSNDNIYDHKSINEVNNIQSPRLLQPPPPPPKPLKKLTNNKIQYNPLGNGFNPNEHPESESNPEFWYHDDLMERERMLKSIYVKPSSDTNNAFYFVGTQRIVRRARPTVN